MCNAATTVAQSTTINTIHRLYSTIEHINLLWGKIHFISMPREKQMKNGHNSKINKNIPNQQTKRRAKLTLILQCCEWLCCFCQVIIQHIDWSNERIFRLLFSELARKRMYRCGSSLCVTHQIVVAANCTGTQHSVSVHLISRRRFSSDV